MLVSQERKNYIIKLNADTVFTKVVKLDKKNKSVIYEEDGRKIKCKAEAILAVKIDTIFYESALVRLKRLKNKHYVFLQITVAGKLKLYEINTRKTKFLMKAFGEDLIHLRWVYRAHDWTKGYSTKIYFYKKENESRKKISKYWKEKTKDCKSLHDKFNSKESPWFPNPRELVQFYNRHCK